MSDCARAGCFHDKVIHCMDDGSCAADNCECASFLETRETEPVDFGSIAATQKREHGSEHTKPVADLSPINDAIRRNAAAYNESSVEVEARLVFGTCGGKCGEAPCVAWNERERKRVEADYNEPATEEEAICGVPEANRHLAGFVTTNSTFGKFGLATGERSGRETGKTLRMLLDAYRNALAGKTTLIASPQGNNVVIGPEPKRQETVVLAEDEAERFADPTYGTAANPLRARGTIREIAERVKAGQWTTLDLDALADHVLAE